MRELEFLPEWYPQTRRRKRLVMLQGWLTVLLVLGMGAFLMMADRNIAAAERSLQALKGQLSQTNSQLAEMDKLDAIRRQLRKQAQITSRLGLYVETCTVIHELERLMPKQMSLTGLQIENEEKGESSAIALARGGEPQVDRRLRIKIQAVCPTAVDMASFLTQLSAVPLFEQVNLNRAGEITDQGHTMHEFELTLVVNLNAGAS
jgi:Tfp pilus assembly protein PilN